MNRFSHFLLNIILFTTLSVLSGCGNNEAQHEQNILHVTVVDVIKKDFQKNKSNITLYPNPVTNILTIESGTVNDGKTILSILNIQGQKLLESKMEDKITQVNIEAFKKGVYFIQLINGSSIETSKFIKD